MKKIRIILKSKHNISDPVEIIVEVPHSQWNSIQHLINIAKSNQFLANVYSV